MRYFTWLLSAGAALATVSVLQADPPASPIPLDARGFTAGQALQQAYLRQLQPPTKAPARESKDPIELRGKAGETPTKSKTAVVVASSPPGGTPPGVLRNLAPGSDSRDKPAAASSSTASGFTARMRSFFQSKGSNTPAPPTAFTNGR